MDNKHLDSEVAIKVMGWQKGITGTQHGRDDSYTGRGSGDHWYQGGEDTGWMVSTSYSYSSRQMFRPSEDWNHVYLMEKHMEGMGCNTWYVYHLQRMLFLEMRYPGLPKGMSRCLMACPEARCRAALLAVGSFANFIKMVQKARESK